MPYSEAVLLAQELSEDLDTEVSVLGPLGKVAAFLGGVRTFPRKLAPVVPVSEVEKECILAALDAHDWRMTKTAEALGMSRSTLFRRITDYGLAQKVKRASA
jgi:transcriptional regulator of acetoin/glycerol metabolism